jgi:hypothetical protein
LMSEDVHVVSRSVLANSWTDSGKCGRPKAFPSLYRKLTSLSDATADKSKDSHMDDSTASVSSGSSEMDHLGSGSGITTSFDLVGIGSPNRVRRMQTM